VSRTRPHAFWRRSEGETWKQRRRGVDRFDESSCPYHARVPGIDAKLLRDSTRKASRKKCVAILDGWMVRWSGGAHLARERRTNLGLTEKNPETGRAASSTSHNTRPKGRGKDKMPENPRRATTPSAKALPAGSLWTEGCRGGGNERGG